MVRIVEPGWNTILDKWNFTYQLILESITVLQPQWTMAGVLVVSQGGTGCIAVVLKVLNLGFCRQKFYTVTRIKTKETATECEGILWVNAYL